MSKSDGQIGLGITSLTVALIWCVPKVQEFMYEKLFRKCIPIADNADNEVYEENFLKFKDDYDRANPHTFKHGKFRMINMQIEKAKANPDEFDAMKLKGFEDQRFNIEKANILSKSR